MRAAPVAGDVLLGFLALAVADEQEPAVADAGESGRDRLVLPVAPVALELDVLVEHAGDVVGGLGPQGVARDLDDVVRGEVGIDLFPHAVQLALQRLQLAVEIHPRRLGEALQLTDFHLELHDGTFEGEADADGLLGCFAVRHVWNQTG